MSTSSTRVAGTTDTRYADQAVQGNVDGKILEIVLGRTTQFEPPILALEGLDLPLKASMVR